MENKVISREFVKENYIHKDKIRNKINNLTEYYEKEVKPEMYHWGDFTAEEYYSGVIAELNMLLEDKLMNKQEAINILIGMAVCISPKLYCDKHCPFYRENKHCKYIGKEFELEEAVKVLKK